VPEPVAGDRGGGHGVKPREENEWIREEEDIFPMLNG
jgi:hypothetical protein